MSMNNQKILDVLDANIQKKHLLTHPFYQAWSRGELSIACLQEYALEYYHHVKEFPKYISAIHSRTSDATARKILLQNLIEEEAGSPNHPELWREFIKALNVSDSQIEEHNPGRDISHLINTFKEICNQEGLCEGVAALYSYESQIPAVCVSKIDGLKKYYGMKNPNDWEYFRIHIAADEAHAAEEKALLQKHLDTQKGQSMLTASSRVLDALWNFLSGLCEKYQISCPTHA